MHYSSIIVNPYFVPTISLNGKSKIYFSEMDANDDIAKAFNIDESYLYEGNIPIKIEKILPRGNIDEYFSEAMDISGQLDVSILEPGLRRSFFKLKSLFYNLYRLVINPGFFKLRYYCSGDGEWTVSTINRFISDVSGIDI